MAHDETATTLRRAQAQRDRAAAQFGWSSAEVRRATEHLLAVERAVSATAGEEYAEVIPFGPPWSAGAPLPHVLASERALFLVYVVAEASSGRDDGRADLINTSGPPAERLAIIQFTATDHRFGGPNDEVLSGHPLFGRGLEFYSAHIVHNSRWLAEQQSIDSVHRSYRPERWASMRHFLLAFHDATFEVIASGFAVREDRRPITAVLHDLVERL